MSGETKYTYNEDGSIKTIDDVPVEWEQVLDQLQGDREADMYAHLYGGEDYRTVHKRQLLSSAPRFFQSSNPLLPRRRIWPWVVLAVVVVAVVMWLI